MSVFENLTQALSRDADVSKTTFQQLLDKGAAYLETEREKHPMKKRGANQRFVLQTSCYSP